MWFGNFQHTVYQLASFHVRLRLGKEEAWQMRAKVWCFRSLCARGCGGTSAAKLFLWTLQSQGLGLPASGPEGMESKTAARVDFAWNAQSQSPLLLEISVSCWCETSKKQTTPSNYMLHLQISSLPPVVSFFPSTNICENVEKHFCIDLSIYSTHRQNEALLSLPLWHILTARIPATGKQPFPSILRREWSDFLMHDGQLLILKLVQWLSGRCPHSFLLLRCRSLVSFPYGWRSVLHKSWCLKERTILQAGVGKVKMQKCSH